MPEDKPNITTELLLEKINQLETKVEEKDKKIDELIGFNRTLLSRKAPITTDKKEDITERAKAKLDAFITKGEE